jgi:hypothetical protein
MNKTWRLALVAAGLLAGAFVILSVMNIRRGPSVRTVERAVTQIGEIEKSLVSRPVDWQAVRKQYHGPLVALVKDTRRFLPDANLNNKVRESIAEGAKTGFDDIQAIIVSRTFLRVCWLHLIATLAPQQEEERALNAEDRRARATILLKPVERFLLVEGQRLEEPLGNELPGTVQEAVSGLWPATLEHYAYGKSPIDLVEQEMDVVAVRVILARLAKWRALDLRDREQRLKAIALQADMRQLIYFPYERMHDRLGREAWTAMTAFTANPSEMSAQEVEDTLRRYLALVKPENAAPPAEE